MQAGEARSEETYQEPTPEELAAMEEMTRSQGSASGSLRRSGRPSMDPFLMTSFRTRQTVKTILGRDADDFKNAKEMENNLHWQKFARAIDDFSRVVFPMAFSIALAIEMSKAPI